MNKKIISLSLCAGLILSGLGVSNIPSSQASTSATASAAVTTGSSITVTLPAPTITEIKGGTERVKLYWKKISNATGYKIYSSTSQNGTYSLIKTITSNATTKYVKTGLTQKKTYYFKMIAYASVNNMTFTSAYSSVKSAKTCSVSSTSKSAKSYSTKSKFQSSKAYKKYSMLNKKSNYSKSFAIPGMKNTNNGGFAATKMIPQGLCQAGGYYLISAYDYTGMDESVIYVLSRSSHSYITTIVLPSKAQVNSLAYDGKNIWISKGSLIACFPYSVISNAATSGKSYTTLSAYSKTFTLNTKPQVIAYNDGILWAGANTSATSYMYGYKVDAANSSVNTKATYYMSIPSRAQGVTFDSDGYMYLTRSYRTNSTKSGYTSQIRTYKPSFSSPTSKGGIKKGSIIHKYSLPPMAEGITTYGSYTYINYSGCKYSSCTYKVDRIIAVKKSYFQ